MLKDFVIGLRICFKCDILRTPVPKQASAQDAPTTALTRNPTRLTHYPLLYPVSTTPSSQKHRGITEGFFKLGLTDRVPGVLEFDFVSIARPSSDTSPLTPGQFDRYVGRLHSFLRYLRCWAVMGVFLYKFTTDFFFYLAWLSVASTERNACSWIIHSAGEVMRPEISHLLADPR